MTTKSRASFPAENRTPTLACARREIAILDLLANADGLTAEEIASKSGIDGHVLHRCLRLLREDGLIEFSQKRWHLKPIKGGSHD